MRAHAGAAWVHLCVNEGSAAGATIPHTHAQLFALDFVPAAIARERERFGAYATRTMGANLLAELVQHEVRQRERIVAIDAETVLISPYGARVPYQLLIAPRTPRMRFEDDGPTGAAMLHAALQRLARLLGASPPLHLWVRTAPQGSEQFCWRIDILPALTQPAGLELGAGVGVNVVSPEQAAAELRDA
jgi:UDPglucose--hexose-1-phosphate uridylyltransferase